MDPNPSFFSPIFQRKQHPHKKSLSPTHIPPLSGMEANFIYYNYVRDRRGDLNYVSVRNMGSGHGLYTSQEEACQRAADATGATDGMFVMNSAVCDTVRFSDNPTSARSCEPVQQAGLCQLVCHADGCDGYYYKTDASGYIID